MYSNFPHYLPLSLPFFGILAGIVLFLVALIELRILRYAYTRLGIGPRAAIGLLIASLIGSYFNIPIVELPAQHITSDREIIYYGMHYIIPLATNRPGTVVAINVGGALIPGMMSLYLLTRHALWVRGMLAITCVATVCHLIARPVHGLGIALPVFVPSIVTAFVALVLSRRHAASLAYIAGSMGALIGADLLNLGQIQGLGAPVVSIGGAGTFDGVFLTGILAVLIASFSRGGDHPISRRGSVPTVLLRRR